MASKAKALIVNSFFNLLETELYDKITVTSLVEACDISRQTFYYHFNDIEEMIAYAFQSETEAICKAQEPGKWYDSARLYVSFLDRFDTLLRKAQTSPSFLFVYHLLYQSFYDYITAYLEKRNRRLLSGNSDLRFFITCAAHSLCGLVIDETQKPESDYATVLENIGKTLNALPK